MRPRNDEGRRSSADPATTNLNYRPAYKGDPPILRVLERLDRVRQSPSGWTARCPSHDDRYPSLSIAAGSDGRILIFDHGGCATEDVVAAIGLELVDLFPPRADEWRPEPGPRGREHQTLPRNVATGLLWRSKFPLEWAIGKLLAPLPPTIAKSDLLAGWDFLRRQDVDIAFIWATVTLIRGAALFSYCDRDHGDQEHVARAVRRLLSRIDAEVGRVA